MSNEFVDGTREGGYGVLGRLYSTSQHFYVGAFTLIPYLILPCFISFIHIWDQWGNHTQIALTHDHHIIKHILQRQKRHFFLLLK